MRTENRLRWILGPIGPAILVTLLLLGTILGLSALFQKSPEKQRTDEKKPAPGLFQDMTADSGATRGDRSTRRFQAETVADRHVCGLRSWREHGHQPSA